MAEMMIKLKIQDLDSFKELIEALGGWANEVSRNPDQTDAERALLHAATALEETAAQ